MLANGAVGLDAVNVSVLPVLEDTYLVDGFQSSSVSGDNSAAALTTVDRWVASAAPVQDFDADGYADVLWRDAAIGAAALITLDGLTIKKEMALKPYIQGEEWEIQGVGQFDADDSPDLLWRNQATGQNLIWLMDGEVPTSSIVLPTITDLNWEIRGVGNFEPSVLGSRADDLLWFNPSTGERSLWLMEGTEKRSSLAIVPDRAAPGDLLGIGDFDGNNTPDLLWQQETGALLFWKMDGTQFVAEGTILPAGNEAAAFVLTADAIASDRTAVVSEPHAVHHASAVSGIEHQHHTESEPESKAADADALDTPEAGDAALPENVLLEDHLLVGDHLAEGGLEATVSGAKAVSETETSLGEHSSDGVSPQLESNTATSDVASSVSSSILLQSPDWILGGIADYNRDGKDDILWQRRHDVIPASAEADALLASSVSGAADSTLSITVPPIRQEQALVPWEIRLWEINVASDATSEAIPSEPERYPSRETVLFKAFIPESYEKPKVAPIEFTSVDLPVVPGDSPVLPSDALDPVLDPNSPDLVSEAVLPEENEFNIDFDYRFDSQNWFTSERRAALEAAAAVWERLLLDEFATTPAGTATPFVRHPETENIYVDALGQPSTIYTTDVPIDDVVILVGTQSLGPTGSLSLAAASGFFNDEPRYVGERFQPWLGSLTVNRDVNWFFDATPLTDDDIPPGQSDFISTAIHEIGHVLGFSRSIPAFSRYVSPSGDRFIGPQSLARTDNLGIPLDTNSSHIEDGFDFAGSGETALDPVSFRGKRQLPTILDAAIFDDLGYTVDYSQVAQNLPESA